MSVAGEEGCGLDRLPELMIKPRWRWVLTQAVGKNCKPQKETPNFPATVALDRYDLSSARLYGTGLANLTKDTRYIAELPTPLYSGPP